MGKKKGKLLLKKYEKKEGTLTKKNKEISGSKAHTVALIETF